ncbi:MAG: HEAT repeat domain-containing protein [Planctomycetes bacterium]|nr:HEAT repeat domain-containing protein [Planctomycetota bacterium]
MKTATILLLAMILAIPAGAVSAAEEEQPLDEQIAEAIKQLTTEELSWRDRKKAIDLLAQNPEASAGPLLDSLDEHENSHARLWLLLCINSFDDMAVFEAGAAKIIKLLADESFGTKFWAIKTMAKMKLAAAVKPLTEMLSTKDDLLRAATAAALGKIGVDTPIKQLIPLLDDPQEMVRRAAAEALGDLKATDAKARLIVSLADENLVVKRAAVIALEKITGKSFDIKSADWAGALDVIEKKINTWIEANK